MAALLLALALVFPHGTATIATPQKRVNVRVEIANNDARRERGLMFRTRLAPNAGMAFVWREDVQGAFWMKNTLIPLDMIFIRADGTIARIVTAKPLDETAIPAGEPIAAVLEIAGGRAAELGIREGDKAEWEH